MGTLNTNQLNYISVLCEAALYGAFSVLILVVIWTLLTSKKMPNIHMVMFGASISMWIIATIHLGLLIQRLTLGVTQLWEAKGAVSLATLGLAIGDCILIWRVYSVWGRNWWVTIIPAILMIAAAAIRFALVANGAEVVMFGSDTASNDIIIANTVYCTALISGRIWYINRKTRNDPFSIVDPTIKKRNVYEGVILLIIETGSLYALSLLIATIVEKVHSPGVHVILNITMPWTGILPTLIILAVHFKFVPGTRNSGGTTDSSLTIETLGSFHAADRIISNNIAELDTPSRKEASTLNLGNLSDEAKNSNSSMA